MKKGFTLLELLAVIVVIAILTLVALPQLVRVISASKESSKLETTKNYIKALEDQIIAEQFDKASLKNGCYIVEDGIINRKGNYANPEDAKIIPDAKGELPSEGWVIMKDDSVIKGQFVVDDTVIEYDGKDAHLTPSNKGYALDSSCEED